MPIALCILIALAQAEGAPLAPTQADSAATQPAGAAARPSDAATKPASSAAARSSGAASKPAPSSSGKFGAERLIRITSEGVNLRSRPDKNSIAVAQVDSGDVLRADGEEFGWLSVIPPEGAFSFVSAEHVEASGDAGRVRISSGTLRVRVGSAVTPLDPASSDVQARLPNGAAVTIIERVGDWYKIKPPPEVRLYVAAEFTLPAGALGAARMPIVSDATRRPATSRPAAQTRPRP